MTKTTLPASAAKPRAWGVGEIKEIASDRPGTRKWLLRVSLGKDPVTGDRRTRTERFYGNRTEANTRLRELAAPRDRNTTAMTVQDLIEAWWPVKRQDLATGSRVKYEITLARIPETFRRTAAAAVTGHDLNQLYAWTRENVTTRTGSGASAAVTLHQVLSMVFRYAVDQGWLTTAPKATAKRAATLAGTVPPDDVLPRLLAVTDDDMERAFVTIAVLTGARCGEMGALRWQDVDLDRREIVINGTLETDGTRKLPKTMTGVRTVPLPATVVTELARWRRIQAERALAVGVRLDPSAYILSRAIDGRDPWRPSAMGSQYRTWRRKAGLPPRLRLHDLRHGAAVRMLKAGVDVVTAARLLGHHPSVFVSVYGNHIVADSARLAIDALERAYAAQ